MFYGQCNDCGERWELGTASTCKCPDFWEGYVPEPVKPAQQEPVAWICEGSSSDEKHAIDYWSGDVDDLPIGTQLYAAPQRTWVGLTDKEIGVLWFEANDQDNSMIKHFARAIEAKLRSKNEDRI